MFLFLTTAQSVLLYSSLHPIPSSFHFCSPHFLSFPRFPCGTHKHWFYSPIFLSLTFSHISHTWIGSPCHKLCLAMFACCPAVLCFSLPALPTTSQLFLLFILYTEWMDEWIKSFFLKTNASHFLLFLSLYSHFPYLYELPSHFAPFILPHNFFQHLLISLSSSLYFVSWLIFSTDP